MSDDDDTAEQRARASSRLHREEAEAYALLIDGVQEGLRLLQVAVGHKLLGLIRRYYAGNGEHFCQDVYSWTLARVWQKIDQYDETKGRMLTWMTRIARNRAIGLNRRSKRIEDAVARRAHLRTSPDFVIYRETVQRFLDELSRLQRAIVISDLDAYPERLPAKLMAERLGPSTTVDSVYTQRSKAFKKLEHLTGLPKPGGKQ